MSVSEFHLYLLLIHDFHNKHNFSQKPTRFSSGSNCCDKLGRKKVAALPGTGVFQFGLSTHAHACVHTHTHTPSGCRSEKPHRLPLSSRACRRRQRDAPHLAGRPLTVWFIMGNEVHFQETGDTVIGLSKAFSLNLLKLYLFLRELGVIS